MDREEILLASGVADNVTLNALESLAQRRLIFRDNVYSGYRARHRVIADEIVDAMRGRALMEPALEGICFAFANRINPNLPRSSRPWRRLIRFTNHAFILRMTTPQVGRDVYSRLEEVLSWDYHYWLQRGSLEVEEGDLELATNFINQARSLAEGERPVETEYAYLLMKKAAANPGRTDAKDWFNEGSKYLENLTDFDGDRDPYPYHVLGSQGLAWIHQAPLPVLEKRNLLHHLLEIVRSGVQKHPGAEDLPLLAKDLEREWLMTAAVDAK